MSNIWIVSDSAEVAAQMLTPALALAGSGDTVRAMVTTDEAAKAVADCGVAVLRLQLADNRFESAIAVMAEQIKAAPAKAVLVGATPRGREVAAGLAALLDAGMASEVSEVRADGDAVEVKRYVLGGMAVSTLRLVAPACMSIAGGTFVAPAAAGAAGAVTTLDVPADARVSVESLKAVAREGVDLASAKRVVCVGRGLEKQEDLAIIEALAKALGAETACSRGVAEDLKWMPLDKYVGISGVRLKADVHVSVGISGQVQHVAGIRDAKVIVAVDQNENALIFQAADYGVVGNLYDIVPALTKALA